MREPDGGRPRHWPPQPIPAIKSGLDRLALAVQERPDSRSDDEQIWLTRFLVVRTCGYLEQVTHETTKSYINAKAGGLVRSFAVSWLARSQNPTPENLLNLVGRFGDSLRDDLSSLLDEEDQRLHREISFLVDRRNKIAHGLNEGMNAGKAASLKADAETVAAWFIDNLRPF